MTPLIQRTELKTFYYTPVHCPFCGVRVMGADGMNLRANVDDGKVTKDGDHKYAESDMHKGEKPTPVVTGFLNKGERYGRPCDILPVITGDDAFDPVDAFLFTDDHNGVLYLVRKKED